MAAAGLGPGDRVAFCLPSSAALLCAVLGALRVGVVPVLLNATLLDAERDGLVADAEPQMVVTDGGGLARLDTGAPVELAPYPLARPMHYTSGTTGRAKGVWSGLWDAATAEPAPSVTRPTCGPSAPRRPPGLLADVPLGVGALRRRHPAAGWHLCHPRPVRRRHGPGRAARPARPGAQHHLHGAVGPAPAARRGRGGGRLASRSLRLLAHAGSPCPPSLKREAMARVRPGVLWEFYGSTEGQFTVCSPEEWLARPGTVGRARPGRRLAVDDDGSSGARPRRSPTSPTGGTRRRRHRRGGTDRSPWGISGASMTRATSSSTGGGTTSSSPAG